MKSYEQTISYLGSGDKMGKVYIGDEEVALYRTTYTDVDIIDNLSSTRTDAALSANQGKVLNEKKQERLVRGVGIELNETTNEISAQPMVGATETASGQLGAVPTPESTDKDKFLKGDGTWAEPPTGSTEIDNETIKRNEDGKIYAVKSTNEDYGVVKVDNDTITIDNGVISAQSSGSVKIDDKTIKKDQSGKIYAVKATDKDFGIVNPDNKTVIFNDDGKLKSVDTLNNEYKLNEIIVGDGLKREIFDGYKNNSSGFFSKYIYNTGNTWIQTDITDINHISFDMTIIKPDRVGTGGNIFGAVSSTNPKDRLALIYDEENDIIEFYYGTNDNTMPGYFSFECKRDQEINIHFDENGCVFTNLSTGEKSYFKRPSKNIVLDKPLQIFGINNAEDGKVFNGCIGRFIISANKETIYDCVPFKDADTKNKYLNLINCRIVSDARGVGFSLEKQSTYSLNLNVPKISLKNFEGATADKDGVTGGVPAPTREDVNKFLKSDGTWQDVSGGGYSEGSGIKIKDGVISAKVDGTTVKFNEKNELVSLGEGGLIKDVEDMCGLYVDADGTLFIREFSGQTAFGEPTGVVPRASEEEFRDRSFLRADGTWGKYKAGKGIEINEEFEISSSIVEYTPTMPADPKVVLWIRTDNKRRV